MSRKSLDGFIEELHNVTHSTYPRKFCFFLGAGASITSGIPSGQDLVRQWDAYLKKDNPKGHLRWQAQLGITEENMVSFYSEYYDRRFQDFPTDGYAEIERITAAGRPSAGYLMLAQMLTQSPHNVVITTNFDHLTEDAVSKFTGRIPLVIGHENLAKYVTGQPTRPTIIKIHRDLLLEPKSATTALQTMDKQWAPALDRIFSNYHPVFLGYAGNDKSVMDYLQANAGRFKTDWKKPYWMFYGEEVKSPTVRKFLEDSDGIRMFGCGFDEVMVWMGQALGYELPDLGAIQEREMEAFGVARQAYDEICCSKPFSRCTEHDSVLSYCRDGSGDIIVYPVGEAKPLTPLQAGDDELIAAVDVILETRHASLSVLRQALNLSYAKAFQLLRKMEDLGIIGRFAGTDARAILVTRDQWQAMRKSIDTP